MLGVKHAVIDRYIYTCTYIYLRNAWQYNQIKIQNNSE